MKREDASSRLFVSLISFSSMTFVSRLLGLVRDLTFSAAFGASAASDAFWIAVRIPNFLRRIFAEGAFSSAFVPVLMEVKQDRPNELACFVANVSGVLSAALLLVTLLGILLAPAIAFLFCFGDVHGEKFVLVERLLTITFPFIIFVSLTALGASILNSFSKFAIPALTPVILNICMIIGAVWGSTITDPPIVAMGWALLMAGVLQLVLQAPSIARLGLLVWPKWNWRNCAVRKVLRLMLPTLFGSSVAQVNLLLDTLLAAGLVAGSQTWMSQADRLLELPLGMFGAALGIVMLPALTRHHVSGDSEAFNRALNWGIRTVLIISVPAAAALLILAEPLIATLFQRGKFSSFDIRMTSMSLMSSSLGLPAFAAAKVMVSAFYSRHDMRSPVRAGIASIMANAILNFVLLAALILIIVPPWQRDGSIGNLLRTPGLHIALGLASALAGYVNAALLWRKLRQENNYIASGGWMKFFFSLSASSVLMVLALSAGLSLAPEFTASTEMTRIGWLAALLTCGATTYLVAMYGFGFRMSDISRQ